jgi:hypothetical protein
VVKIDFQEGERAMDVYERIQAAVAEVWRRLPEATVTGVELGPAERDDLAQKLADSPCPECRGLLNVARYEPMPSGSGQIIRFGCKCSHCGDFPEPRRGHFAIDAPDAMRRVAGMNKEER